ncbi:phosphatase PAP2 family protein [Enterococcus hirae]|nr:phosphatase PAP2/LCP family protein [Enterococcus sp. 10A9_DIV0425]THE16157.1 phosphatase PAP2 family protein [Enterococcus hirae]
MRQIPKKILWLSIVSTCLLGGLTLLVVTKNAYFYEIDSAIYTYYKPIDDPLLTQMIGYIAKLATLFPTILLTFIIAIFSWKKNYRNLALWNIVTILSISFLGFIWKQGVHRPRPDVEQLIPRSSYSFPSGHSILSMGLFLLCLVSLYVIYDHQKIRKFYWLGILYPLGIAFSRLYLRVHYPSDILAGFLLSLAVVGFSYCVFSSYISQQTVTNTRKKRQLFTRKQKGGLAFMFLLLCLILTGVVYSVRFYIDAKNTVGGMQQPLQRETVVREKDTPVSILVLGIANDSKRKSDYRANTIMLVTLNNQKKTTTITSIPRDSFVEIANQDGLIDKINHAHSYGGIDMMVDTVEQYLQIPIHHYVTLNMDGLEDLIDAVGGITVNNAFEFDAEGIHYPEGVLELNGWEGLQYARMRAEDPENDYGRQKRQREVVNVLVQEFLSVRSLFNYRNLLDVVGENGTTDLSLDEMIGMMNDYHLALGNITNHQLKGEQYIGDGILGEAGIYYEKIPEEERERIIDLLHEQLEIKNSNLSND